MGRKLVYSDKYHRVDIGQHVFPVLKYKLIHEQLIVRGLATKGDFVEPAPASEEDILLVHTPEYVKKLRDGTLSQVEIYTLELPYSPELVDTFRICAGGTTLSGEVALAEGIGIHIGGGFHHAFPDHGEGFCVFNDVAIAIRKLQKDNRIIRSCVIDCDLHQGNGTAYIFRDDKDVFTFSIHQENNYPAVKPPSDLDIGLEDGTGDDIYLAHLEKNIPKIVERSRPDLIIYLAGADPYRDDQLGGLFLTMDGLKRRDEIIIHLCHEKGIPLVILLAGGYAWKTEETIEIHCQTIASAIEE